MAKTPVRPYPNAGQFENWCQKMIPAIMHLGLFAVVGVIGQLFAFGLNAFLVLYLDLSYGIAYAIVIPLQLLLNFAISRIFIFAGSYGNVVQQVGIYVSAVIGLRLIDWAFYVIIVSYAEIPFLVLQLFNAIVFLFIRYKLATFIFEKFFEYSTSSEKGLESQDGVIIGNITDKASLKNPIAKKMVANFDACLLGCFRDADAKNIHEIGCGEGRLASMIQQHFNLDYRGSDFSFCMIEIAQSKGISKAKFKQADIYDLDSTVDSADTIVCCEVLEHLEAPEAGLNVLKRLAARQYILSVPREPFWRLLNMARLKYVDDRGNTPGHLSHWSSKSFCQMLEDHGFEIECLRQPFPWTMVRGYFRND